MDLYLDKASPDVWRAAGAFSTAVAQDAAQRGLTPQESELIKVRASQINGCAFCLDLHTRQARDAGVTQQHIDMLPAWRDTGIYSERERAVLAVAEAGTEVPLNEDHRADLVAARRVLGDDVFLAAEWVTSAINLFNRISILSKHPVKKRDADGKVIS